MKDEEDEGRAFLGASYNPRTSSAPPAAATPLDKAPAAAEAIVTHESVEGADTASAKRMRYSPEGTTPLSNSVPSAASAPIVSTVTQPVAAVEAATAAAITGALTSFQSTKERDCSGAMTLWPDNS